MTTKHERERIELQERIDLLNADLEAMQEEIARLRRANRHLIRQQRQMQKPMPGWSR